MNNCDNKNYKIYCLSYNNLERKNSMKNRFDILDLNYMFYDGINFDDVRLNCPESYKKCWSCMYGHLDMIENFYNDPSVNYGIFCEDDIYIRKDFSNVIPKIIKDFEYMNLDVLSLGYLISFKIENNNSNFNLIENSLNNIDCRYYNFLNNYDVWGTQMYMLSKENAKKILEKYDRNSNYAIRTLTDNSLTPFSADWTITKDGNRGLIYPCIAVEDNNSNISHYNGCISQFNYHKLCHEIQYDSNLFI
jgi:GR25 family glycosyltransferase involved in LPS biosynthesis